MIELHPHDMAHGGEAVARRDGKAHFVAGAIPGEVVTASVSEDKGSWARASLVDVIEASPDRRTPPCPHAATCGGCQWQFIDVARQRDLKRGTVEGQLRHLGRLDAPTVHPTMWAGPEFGYRNRMDFRVDRDRPALMRARSNAMVPLDVCLLLDPSLRSVFDRLGDLTGVERITLRTGTRTGSLAVIVDGDVPAHARDWGADVAVVKGEGVESVIGQPAVTEVVDETRFDIPLLGFFQNNTWGADLLVQLVRQAAELTGDEVVLDAYSGVGLFGATVGAGADFVIGIDADAEAIEAARRNLTRAGVDHRYLAGTVTSDIERLDAYWDVAIVDPPRKGLGERGVDAVTSAMPRRVVYVSCDPASLARDARIFTDLGYHFRDATPVDLFPQTFHVETVATFDRDRPSAT